jgi:hypothetical protein
MRWYSIIWFFCLSLFMSGCDSLGLDGDSSNTHTVLVYVVASNSLEEYSTDDYEEMLEGMKSVDARNNLLVYMDTYSGEYLLKLSRASSGSVRVDTITKYASQISTNSAVMKKVLTDAFTTYPADSYGLILWSHGDGWLPAYTSAETASSSTSTTSKTRWFGQSHGYEMDINSLKEAFASSSIPHLDFILFDACYMQTVEVAYALRSYTDYMIGSPLEITANGGPYQRVVPFMFADRTNEKQYVENIAKVYYTYYHTGEDSSWDTGVCLSVIDCNQLDSLASATSAALTGRSAAVASLDLTNVQYFDPLYSYVHAFYDMDDVMSHVASTEGYAAWSAQLAKTIVWNGTEDASYSAYINSTFAINKDCGISMYVPVSSSSLAKEWNTFYHQLDWYTASGMSQVGW